MNEFELFDKLDEHLAAIPHLQDGGYIVLDPSSASVVRTVCDLLYHMETRGKSEERYRVYDRAARNFLGRLKEQQPRYDYTD